MAYTTFQKEFWSDDYVLELTPIQKLIYAYIITNEKTTQCGIYELPLKKATAELSISAEEFLIHLKKFNDDKKISYSLETQEICVINWLKHNENSSWKTMERVRKELTKIKNPNLVVLLYDPRKPLFDGTRKKRQGKDYIEEQYIIYNPWNELFKEISDEILLEIRKPFLKYAPLMPLLCPIDAPSKGYLPYTNSLHNITNSESYTNSKAETDTVKQSGIEKEFTPPPPFVKSLSQIIESIRIHWNTKNNLPEEPFSMIQNSHGHEIVESVDTLGKDKIIKAIDNLDKYYLQEENPPQTFSSFMDKKKIVRWLESSNPGSRYKNKIPEFENDTRNF